MGMVLKFRLRSQTMAYCVRTMSSNWRQKGWFWQRLAELTKTALLRNEGGAKSTDYTLTLVFCRSESVKGNAKVLERLRIHFQANNAASEQHLNLIYLCSVCRERIRPYQILISLEKVKSFSFWQGMFSDHGGVKLEINNRRKFRNPQIFGS